MPGISPLLRERKTMFIWIYKIQAAELSFAFVWSVIIWRRSDAESIPDMTASCVYNEQLYILANSVILYIVLRMVTYFRYCLFCLLYFTA